MSESTLSIITRLRKCEDDRRTATPTAEDSIDDGPVASTSDVADAAVDDLPETAAGESKTNRAVQKWQSASEELFYEGVKMHGKNYQKIERYMSSKTKDRAYAKNYEQIRHHYYNQVKLLTQLVPLHSKDFGPDVRITREVRELFLLVNNSVWSKATKHLRTKNTAKFKELICTGSTTLKVPGKPIRTLRTPQCPALKKFFDMDTTTRCTRLLDDQIVVELLPATQLDAEMVCRTQHNPCVRLKINANDSIRPLFTTLQRRWVDKRKVGDDEIDGKDVTPSTVTLLPSPGLTLTDVEIRESNEQATPTTVCLNEYINRHSTTKPHRTVVSPAKVTGDAINAGSRIADAQDTPPSPPTETSFSADLLRDGLTESTIGCMTAGHLALMCNGTSTIRLQYKIQSAAEDADYTAFEQQMMEMRAKSQQRKRQRIAKTAHTHQPMQWSGALKRKLPRPIITSEPVTTSTVPVTVATVTPFMDTVGSASSSTVEPFAHWKTPPKRQPIVGSSGLSRFAADLSADEWSRSQSGTNGPQSSASKLRTDFGDEGHTLNTPPRKR